MEQWEYGYLYEIPSELRWVIVDAAGTRMLQDASVRLKVRNDLGRDGWIIDDGYEVRAPAWLAEVIGRPGVAATCITSYMRRRLG